VRPGGVNNSWKCHSGRGGVVFVSYFSQHAAEQQELPGKQQESPVSFAAAQQALSGAQQFSPAAQQSAFAFLLGWVAELQQASWAWQHDAPAAQQSPAFVDCLALSPAPMVIIAAARTTPPNSFVSMSNLPLERNRAQ
jgi:hypothetical protein